MVDNPYELELRYEPPTEQEAIAWLESNEGKPASGFACFYPGRYYEAKMVLVNTIKARRAVEM